MVRQCFSTSQRETWSLQWANDQILRNSFILYETPLYRGNAILDILYSRLKKIIRDSRILVDEKASDFVLSWTFVQKLLVVGRGVLLKIEAWEPGP